MNGSGKSQRDRFIEAARKHGVDEDEGRFLEKLAIIARHKPERRAEDATPPPSAVYLVAVYATDDAGSVHLTLWHAAAGSLADAEAIVLAELGSPAHVEARHQVTGEPADYGLRHGEARQDTGA